MNFDNFFHRKPQKPKTNRFFRMGWNEAIQRLSYSDTQVRKRDCYCSVSCIYSFVLFNNFSLTIFSPKYDPIIGQNRPDSLEGAQGQTNKLQEDSFQFNYSFLRVIVHEQQKHLPHLTSEPRRNFIKKSSKVRFELTNLRRRDQTQTIGLSNARSINSLNR